MIRVRKRHAVKRIDGAARPARAARNSDRRERRGTATWPIDRHGFGDAIVEAGVTPILAKVGFGAARPLSRARAHPQPAAGEKQYHRGLIGGASAWPCPSALRQIAVSGAIIGDTFERLKW